MMARHPLTLKLLMLLLLPACAGWNAYSAWHSNREAVFAASSSTHAFAEWPATWQGHALRPLALSDVEQRFAQGFPGQIARLTNERDMLVWRHVTKATRMLHPAVDCYRATGWRVRDERLEQTDNGQRWRCFVAELTHQGATKRLRVCERIEDADGQGFTDTSAWYWAAITGQSSGPWQAITVASPLNL